MQVGDAPVVLRRTYVLVRFIWRPLTILRGVRRDVRKTVDGRYVGFTLMWERSICGFRAGEAWGEQRAGFVRGTKGAITGKIKHAIKLKTSPARLTHLLHNCCSPH